LIQITLQPTGSGLALKPEVQIIVVPLSWRDLRAQNGATNHAHANNNEHTKEWCKHDIVEAGFLNCSLNFSVGEGSGWQHAPQQKQGERLPIAQAAVGTRLM